MNWIMYRVRQARHAARWLLLPVYLAYYLYSQTRCFFGWHRYGWHQRPMWHDGVPLPLGYRHFEMCLWCGAGNPATEYFTRGEYYDDESEAGE